MLTRFGVATAALALVVMLAGPVTYSVATAATEHGGAIPTAGPEGQTRPGARLTAGPRPGDGGQPPPGMELTRGGPPGGRSGGMLGGAKVSDELQSLVTSGASGYAWPAATTRGNSAAALQLATEQPVLAIGGFNGTDPAPTLQQFQQLYVTARCTTSWTTEETGRRARSSTG